MFRCVAWSLVVYLACAGVVLAERGLDAGVPEQMPPISADDPAFQQWTLQLEEWVTAARTLKDDPTRKQINKKIARELTKTMQPAVEVYREQGIDAGIEAVREIWAAITSGAPNAAKRFYVTIWREAQIRSGTLDTEWSLRLYQLLREKNNERGRKVGLGALQVNLVICNVQLGRLGEAHRLLLETRAAIREKGVEPEVRKLKDLGPLFPELSDARLRELPFQPESLYDPRRSTHLGYNILHLTSPFMHLGFQALREGDWAEAAEIFDCIRRITDQALSGLELGQWTEGELQRDFAVCTMGLASVLARQKLHEQALSLIDDLIARNYKWPYEGRHVNAPLARREMLLLTLGRSDADAPKRMAERVAHAEGNVFYDWSDTQSLRIDYAQILHHHGFRQEAWQLLEEILAQAQVPHRRGTYMEVRAAMIDLALDENRTEDVAEWLREVLTHKRQLGLKLGEVSIYKKYIQYLKLIGDDALAERAEADYWNLVTKLRLQNRTRPIHADPAAGRESVAGSPPSRTFTPTVYLDPSVVWTESLPGQPPTMCFTLSNVTQQEVTGMLSLTGAKVVETDFEDPAGWAIQVASSDTSEWEQPKLTLLAEEQRQLWLTAPVDEAGTVTLSWTDGAGQGFESAWHYQSGEASTIAITNANLIHNNPFFLAPLHFIVATADTQSANNLNMRVRSSQPCRVEIYDGTTGTLLAIDAQGDGAWNLAGDVVSQDADKNGLPDITLPAGKTQKLLELYVLPEDAATTVEVFIDFQSPEGWYPAGSSRLVEAPVQ